MHFALLGYCFSEYNDCTGTNNTGTTAGECCTSLNSLSFQDEDICIPCDSVGKLECI